MLLYSRGAADYNHLGVLIYARGAWPRLNDGVCSGYSTHAKQAGCVKWMLY
jgi:hypothetical protein